MPGSDIVICSNFGTLEVTDAHVPAAAGPSAPVADASQDWETDEIGVTEDGRLYCLLRRAPKTCDADDYQVEHAAHVVHLLAAWGAPGLSRRG